MNATEPDPLSRFTAKLCLTFLLLSLLPQSAKGGQLTAFAGNCAQDSHINPQQRTRIDSAALRFVQLSLARDFGSAFALASTALQQEVQRDQFDKLWQAGILPLGPFTDLTVKHTYLLHLATLSKTSIRTVCGADLGKPDGWVAVSAEPLVEQAYVELEAQTRNNGWTFTLWLVPAGDAWRIRAFYATGSSVVGKNAADLLHLGRSERDQGRQRNAALLLTAAAQLASRGPFFQLGIQPEISKELQSLNLPSDLRGSPPYVWGQGPAAFRVGQLGPMGIGSKIYLTVTHLVAASLTDSQIDRRNLALMDYIEKEFPEYKLFFAGWIIKGLRENGQTGYTSVRELRPTP